MGFYDYLRSLRCTVELLDSLALLRRVAKFLLTAGRAMTSEAYGGRVSTGILASQPATCREITH